MLAIDALDERFLVIAWLSRVIEHEVEASLVESHRVGAGENAYVLELRIGRMPHNWLASCTLPAVWI